MQKHDEKSISRFLSLVLRHQPELIGIRLDDAGWINVDLLLSAMTENGFGISRRQLEQVVTNNQKQRFSFNEHGTRIRASQGHSVDVRLGYEPVDPPGQLFHGTPSRFVEQIRLDGLKKMERHHVHLHEDAEVARQVGGRKGKPVLLVVRAGDMSAAGIKFFVAENGVWLTDNVPVEFIEFPGNSTKNN